MRSSRGNRSTSAQPRAASARSTSRPTQRAVSTSREPVGRASSRPATAYTTRQPPMSSRAPGTSRRAPRGQGVAAAPTGPEIYAPTAVRYAPDVGYGVPLVGLAHAAAVPEATVSSGGAVPTITLALDLSSLQTPPASNVPSPSRDLHKNGFDGAYTTPQQTGRVQSVERTAAVATVPTAASVPGKRSSETARLSFTRPWAGASSGSTTARTRGLDSRTARADPAPHPLPLKPAVPRQTRR